MSRYELSLKPNFSGPRRRRGDIEIAPGAPTVYELNEEQLKAIKADPVIVVKEVKESKSAPTRQINAAKSETGRAAEATTAHIGETESTTKKVK